MAQRVATLAELEAFERTQGVTPGLKGLMAEMATTGVIRYPWRALTPLVCAMLEDVLLEYGVEAQRVQKLTDAVQKLPDAPFTAQRLTEVLLEPRRQYCSGEKLTAALEKLVCVTTTIPVSLDPPERPCLEELRGVNENPPPVMHRDVVSSEMFRGFLERKPQLQANGARGTNLTSHFFATSSE